jgi:transposase
MEDTSPKPSCPECTKLRSEIDELRAELKRLKQQLNLNSSNSSKPPSSDPPWQRRPPSSPSGRKPGGQPGHPGHFRTPLQPTSVLVYVPASCESCGHALSQEPAPADPSVLRHQVLELPQQPIEIVEHQSHARTCPCCGHVTRKPIPAEFKSSIVGPRLSAMLAYWVAKGHVSRRFVLEMLGSVYKVPLSLGTLAACEMEMAAALEKPYQAIQQTVREAAAVHVDETGWRCFQQRSWVWVASAAKAVFYGIYPTRGSCELHALLGNLQSARTVHSDRYGAYNAIALENRQLCWAHLIRDFVRLVDLKEGAQVLGQAGLDAAKAAFELWYRFKDGLIERIELSLEMHSIRDKLKRMLECEQYASASKTARSFAKRILTHFQALWRFVDKEGVEPTNNEAERMLRTMVQWRKNSYGCHSPEGCRFAERMLSVIQTLRKQSGNILDYLTAALTAHRASNLPVPIIATT